MNNRKRAEAYGDRLETLLRESPNQQAEMEYADRRMHEAGLTPVLGYAPMNRGPGTFALNLISENPAIPDYLNLIQARPPNQLETVEELIVELTAKSQE